MREELDLYVGTDEAICDRFRTAEMTCKVEQFYAGGRGRQVSDISS
jgi:hypothetical protein